MTETRKSNDLSFVESEDSERAQERKTEATAVEVQEMDQNPAGQELNGNLSTPSRARLRTYSKKQNSLPQFLSYQNSLPGQATTSKLPTDVEMQTTPTADDIEKNKHGLYKGLLFAAFSSVFFSLSSVIVKYMTEIHPAQLALSRFIGILVFTMPVVIYKQEPICGPKNCRHLLVIRGIVGASNLFLRFYAFRYLPIADASVIVFSVPVFVAIFARIFLKEPCGIFHAITIVITLLGVFLITKMPLVLAKGLVYSNDRLYGVLAAVGSTFFGAMVFVVIRKIKFIHHSVIMFNFGWVAIVESTVLTVLLGSFSLPRCGLNQWLIVLLGIFSYGGQTFVTLALQAEKAAPVSIVRAAVDIILAFIWQILFFQEKPDVYSISGAILVSFCVLLISVRKLVLSLPVESKTRQRLYFLIS